MSDRKLYEDVIDELDFEPGIDATHIGVTVEKGVVALTGHVPSYAQKMAAEQAVWRLKCVKGLAMEIDVRLAGDRKVNDDQIAQRAVDILAWSAWVPEDSVKVKVADGWVTLSGQVEWNHLRKAAEFEVRKLSGVKGVLNHITLSPVALAISVRQRIVDALKRRAGVEADDIEIGILEDGIVRLDGVVEDWNERRAIERAVWSAPGVMCIDDHLSIK